MIDLRSRVCVYIIYCIIVLYIVYIYIYIIQKWEDLINSWGTKTATSTFCVSPYVSWARGSRILFQRGLRRHRHSGARYHRMDKMCNGQQTNIPYLDEFDDFDVLWSQTHCCIFCICLCLHVVTIYRKESQNDPWFFPLNSMYGNYI